MQEFTSDAEVWYLAYGSNLCPGRFHAYILGKSFKDRIPERGCRNKCLPKAEAGHIGCGRLILGSWSKSWNSAIAFLEVGAHGSQFFGRRYRITWEQFLDVAFQENGQAPGDTAIDIQWASRQMGRVGLAGVSIAELRGPIGNLKYPSIVEFAGVDGLSMVTLTGPVPEQAIQDRTWSTDYVKVINKGLCESHPMLTREQIVDYLTPAVGAARFEGDVALAEIITA